MAIRVYSTLSRQKEDFQTVVPGKVGMYLCGPTVYKPSHIGHMVGPVIFDTIKRYLVFNGYDVRFVINITDVDDKLIVRAAKEGVSVTDLAKAMTKDYFDCLKAVNVTSIDVFPYATEHIPEMQAMIASLIEKDYAYPLNGDVYFDVSKDQDYGALSRRSISEMMAGTRVEANDQKRHPADFALWKSSKPGEPAWDSPWGPGRPGWHIECSAMSLKHIGVTLDIHGGGLDLMFPHHENELAQSESCTGHKFARYWLHNGLMQGGKGAAKVGGAHSRQGDAPEPVPGPAADDTLAVKEAQEQGKLAGSKQAQPFREVLARFPGETVRFFLLSTHYRSPIEYSEEALAETGKTIEGFHRLFELYFRITGEDFYALPVATRREDLPKLTREPVAFVAEFDELRERFLAAMDDDFNTGGAIGVLFEMRKALNALVQTDKLETTGKSDEAAMAAFRGGMAILRQVSSLLGLFLCPPPKKAGNDDEFAAGLMGLVLELRAEARASKSWGVSDKIRDRLKALKVVVQDRPDGTATWKRES